MLWGPLLPLTLRPFSSSSIRTLPVAITTKAMSCTLPISKRNGWSSRPEPHYCRHLFVQKIACLSLCATSKLSAGEKLKTVGHFTWSPIWHPYSTLSGKYALHHMISNGSWLPIIKSPSEQLCAWSHQRSVSCSLNAFSWQCFHDLQKKKALKWDNFAVDNSKVQWSCYND